MLRDFFQEVQVDKVSDKIVEQLRSLIQEGKLALGDKLPGERELMRILSVGRSSLREALNKLETLGYVEIRKRKGIFVKSLDSMLSFDPLKEIMAEDRAKLAQLYEVRADIEQANAYQAALARDEKDLRELETYLLRFGSAESGYDFSWRLDQDFHIAVARATHNFFRIHVIMSIDGFAQEYIQPIAEEFAHDPDNLTQIIDHHTAILEAIREQRPEAARQAMKTHLSRTQVNLLLESAKED